MQLVVDDDGNEFSICMYSPHSLRATTATLLLDAGVEISKVQELLGHKHITTTQVYDKRRRSTKESASYRTYNHYVQAVDSFCNWMTPKRIAGNPLLGMERLNAQEDIRHERRALLPDEFAKSSRGWGNAARG